MLFQTTQAHEQLRAKIRAFAEEEVKPIAFSLDQANEFPAEAVKKLGELGPGQHHRRHRQGLCHRLRRPHRPGPAGQLCGRGEGQGGHAGSLHH